MSPWLRTSAVFLSVLCLAAVVASPARAVRFWNESFGYPNGLLPAVSGGNWTYFSGTGTDIRVVSGEAFVDFANGLVFDVRAFPAQGAAAKTYACFRVKVTAPSDGSAPTSSYFACFKDATSASYTARVFVRPVAGDPTRFVFGLGAIGSITIVEWATPLSFGTYYTVATRYDAATGDAAMWVDPTSEASTSLTAAVGIPDLPYRMAGFALRQTGGPAGPKWLANVDDIMVADSFADICLGTTITSGSTWGRIKALYR